MSVTTKLAAAPKTRCACADVSTHQRARAADHAAVGKRAVRIGQREQRDIRAAQRQRRAVVVVGLRQRVEAQRAQRVVKAVEADELQRTHGRHVERARERRAHADAAVEAAIVVLRHVHTPRGGDRERAVVDQRGRRQQLPVERKRVQERLERRARLAAARPRRRPPPRSTARRCCRRRPARRRSRCRARRPRHPRRRARRVRTGDRAACRSRTTAAAHRAW